MEQMQELDKPCAGMNYSIRSSLSTNQQYYIYCALKQKQGYVLIGWENAVADAQGT